MKFAIVSAILLSLVMTTSASYSTKRCADVDADGHVTIEDGATSINNMAFSRCTSLTSIYIPSSVTAIGSYSFAGCTSLTSVTFGDNSQLTSIGNDAFRETGLTPPYFWERGTDYVDPGLAVDWGEGIDTVTTTVDGHVNGNYTVEYKCRIDGVDSEVLAERVVYVRSLTIAATSPYFWERGTDYVDPGLALDCGEGLDTVTTGEVVDGHVNGEYTVQYKCRKDGVDSEVLAERVVHVRELANVNGDACSSTIPLNDVLNSDGTFNTINYNCEIRST